MKRLMNKFKFHCEEDDIREIDKLLKDAYKKYNKAKPKASKLREEYLSKLALELEEEDGIEEASHFKILKHREEVRNKRRAEKKMKGGGVKVVE